MENLPWFNIRRASSLRGHGLPPNLSEVALPHWDDYILACLLVGTWAERWRRWSLVPKEKNVAARAFGAFFASARIGRSEAQL